MGNCAELCAAELGYTRQQQDAYTATSYARAAAATASNKFADEMFTVMVPGGRGKPSVAMDADEECTARSVTAATLAEMRPAGEECNTRGNPFSCRESARGHWWG